MTGPVPDDFWDRFNQTSLCFFKVVVLTALKLGFWIWMALVFLPRIRVKDVKPLFVLQVIKRDLLPEMICSAGIIYTVAHMSH